MPRPPRPCECNRCVSRIAGSVDDLIANVLDDVTVTE